MAKICAGCILIIAVVFVAAEGAVAQTETFEIFGTLVTPPGERPCAFCRVELESMLGASQIVLADGNGDFYFLNLKDDSYRIRVSVRGYEDVVQFVKINAPRARVTIDLMRPSSEGTRNAGRVVNLGSTIEAQPKQAVELFRQASDNHRKHKTDDATRQFEDALRIAPQFFAAHQGLGMSYQALGRLAEAEREFHAARDLNGASSEPLLHLSDLYLLRNDWPSAGRATVDALRRDPQSAKGFFNLGLALYCEGMFDLAKDSLEKALKVDPKMDQAQLLLVNIDLRLRDGKRALEHINLYLEGSPTRSQRVNLSSIRTQLRKGLMPAVGFEISFPIRLGESLKPNLCRD
jgi:tetratricopeptide (TPR) repeat protein